MWVCAKSTGCFPKHPLKPSLCTVSHDPELMLCFRPLIHLWTLGFENKHTYFTQCVHKLHNFKKLNSTLAQRHQPLHAFLCAVNMFPRCAVFDKGKIFFPNDYSDKIKKKKTVLVTMCWVVHSIRVKGASYKKGMCVVLEKNDKGLFFGTIKLILVHSSSVYSVTVRSGDLLCKDGLGEPLFKWFLPWTCRSAWLLPFTSVQWVWSVSNSPSSLIYFRMSDINKCINKAVISDLPSLLEEKLVVWVEKILNQGVENKDDLKYIREEDLVEFVRPIQCRKLVWKLQGTRDHFCCFSTKIIIVCSFFKTMDSFYSIISIILAKNSLPLQ